MFRYIRIPPEISILKSQLIPQHPPLYITRTTAALQYNSCTIRPNNHGTARLSPRDRSLRISLDPRALLYITKPSAPPMIRLSPRIIAVTILSRAPKETHAAARSYIGIYKPLSQNISRSIEFRRSPRRSCNFARARYSPFSFSLLTI